ncbi:hypothetical protein [Chryseolinea lacunae]|uniref:Outer membrane protein beta-barrel domain-containing protein n=1 Tax=Chryseolinea lacunae TaxID=2801331 RepID=A0ABS1KVA5_9BACT|nr:hypothetical protein [Chryseolinea lacunae]MBL0743299.1 hypothetical protein [Chryseolinea lacunae]
MKKTILSVFLFAVAIAGNAQETVHKGQTLGEVTVAAGGSRGSLSVSAFRNWRFGARKRLGVGIGGRATTFLGKNLYYITAPAKLTSESTSPLIFFKENVEANIDSLVIQTAQVTMVNVMLNLDYRIAKKITLGFNIDMLGFSFGGRRAGNYINGVAGKNTSATPTPFNILLISDNDRGSLNSEFYVKYNVREKWAAKLGAQFLFTEFTTDTKVQQYPEPNDRFRNKSLLIAIGATYSF